MIGLFLIALGTGGIKPCVSAFGGDQFGPNQVQKFHKAICNCKALDD
jgi:dipeptide/tripeptide permease